MQSLAEIRRAGQRECRHSGQHYWDHVIFVVRDDLLGVYA